MKTLIGVCMLLVSGAVYAGSATVSWTGPDTNTDGSPINGPLYDLLAYCTETPSDNVTCEQSNPWGWIEVGYEISPYTANSLSDNWKICFAVMRNAPDETSPQGVAAWSVPSNIACVVVP